MTLQEYLDYHLSRLICGPGTSRYREERAARIDCWHRNQGWVKAKKQQREEGRS